MVRPVTRDTTLSPRELAEAIGVSESSVKRWIDAGRVPAQRTSGGHRRIELLPVLRFLRETGRERLVPPGLLGLDSADERYLDDDAALEQRLFELLAQGDGDEAGRLVVGALVARRRTPAELCDGPMRGAMARIGDLWTGGPQGIFVEHRATQILLGLLDRVDALFRPRAGAPVAVGGSFAGDPSLLPTRMAATVLAAEGMHPVNLGADTPPLVLLDAADRVGAKLVWISVGCLTDAPGQREALEGLVKELHERGLPSIVGGREIHRLGLRLAGEAMIGEDMQELAARARDILEECGR